MTQPVWTRPAWITAMVGLVSAFLTIPQIVGDYLTKQQDIRLAEQKTETVKLQNKESKQDQEFKIVSNTLARQGSERIFVLRYLAATLDDDSAKKWAQAEVDRLDDLASLKETTKKTEEELQQKQEELEQLATDMSTEKETLKREIIRLEIDLASKNAEVTQQQQVAGLNNIINPGNGGVDQSLQSYSLHIHGFSGNSQTLTMFYSKGSPKDILCHKNPCGGDFVGPLPTHIRISPGEGVRQVSATVLKASEEYHVSYRCGETPLGFSACDLYADNRYKLDRHGIDI